MDSRSSEIAKELGRRGGKRTLELYGKDHYIKMKKASDASKIKQKELLLDKRQ